LKPACKIPSQKYPTQNRAGGVTQASACLPGKREALSSNLSTAKKKKKKKRQEVLHFKLNDIFSKFEPGERRNLRVSVRGECLRQRAQPVQRLQLCKSSHCSRGEARGEENPCPLTCTKGTALHISRVTSRGSRGKDSALVAFCPCCSHCGASRWVFCRPRKAFQVSKGPRAQV
jgi:hypothetical protein